MGIIEAIGKGFGLSGKLLKVALIFFILNVIMGLISLPLAKPENVGKPEVAVTAFAISIVFFIIFIFLQGGAMGLARDIYKTGSCSMANFRGYGVKYYFRILGLLLIYILVALAIVLVLALIGSGILAVSNNVATRIVVALVAIVVALTVIVLLLLPIYSIVADEAGVFSALKRGIKAGRENFWKILGLFLILVLISVVISLIIGFVIGLATVPLPVMAGQIMITIVNSVVQSYLPIVMMLALMGYYLGLSKKSGSEGPSI